ncbi:MAG: anti-sigma factor antagonist [Clostridia bacterium]|nr:anti-sigma factor antagonist [Clostridia bacterium]
MEKDLFISEYDEEKDRMTVVLSGEIDHHSAVSVRHEIDDMLMFTRPKKLIIDLSCVDFMDSSGLGLIMGRYSLMEKLGGETVIRNPSERVKKILSLAGMERIIRIEKRKAKTNENK